jgi:hypothetical protein
MYTRWHAHRLLGVSLPKGDLPPGVLAPLMNLPPLRPTRPRRAPPGRSSTHQGAQHAPRRSRRVLVGCVATGRPVLVMDRLQPTVFQRYKRVREPTLPHRAKLSSRSQMRHARTKCLTNQLPTPDLPCRPVATCGWARPNTRPSQGPLYGSAKSVVVGWINWAAMTQLAGAPRNGGAMGQPWPLVRFCGLGVCRT